MSSCCIAATSARQLWESLVVMISYFISEKIEQGDGLSDFENGCLAMRAGASNIYEHSGPCISDGGFEGHVLLGYLLPKLSSNCFRSWLTKVSFVQAQGHSPALPDTPKHRIRGGLSNKDRSPIQSRKIPFKQLGLDLLRSSQYPNQ